MSSLYGANLRFVKRQTPAVGKFWKIFNRTQCRRAQSCRDRINFRKKGRTRNAIVNDIANLGRGENGANGTTVTVQWFYVPAAKCRRSRATFDGKALKSTRVAGPIFAVVEPVDIFKRGRRSVGAPDEQPMDKNEPELRVAWMKPWTDLLRETARRILSTCDHVRNPPSRRWP